MDRKIFLFFFLISISLCASIASAASVSVTGYAWSENIGWIQMNPGFGGVSLDTSTGNFSGYAWSDNIGWIDFAPASGFPQAPNYGAKMDLGTGNVTGWIKAIGADANGWDGWIKMSGTSPDYGVTVSQGTGDFSGWAWGSDVVGWISFNCLTDGSCANSNYKVVISVSSPPSVSLTADPNPINYNASSTLTWSAVNATTCTASGDWSGAKNPVSGSESTGNLTSDKTYILTCTGPGGTASASVTVAVNPAPILSCVLSANPSSGQSPLNVILSVSASGGSGTGYQYRFDYTNDSIYDTSYSASSTSTYTYTANSVAKAEVKDSNDTTATCTSSIGIISDLSVSLSANPDSGPVPLAVDLTADVSGTAQGTINYTFWWNCSRPGTSVSFTQLLCGDPNNPSIGAKYDGVIETSKTVNHTYSSQGSYTAKVIVERGTASPAESRKPISVGPAVPYFSLDSSNALLATIIESQPATTNETTITVTPVNDFDENISLSVQSVSPSLSGATYNFSDSALSPAEYSAGSKFSVSVPGSADSGAYTITIKGDGGTFVSTVDVRLNIESFSSDFWDF